MLLWVFVPGSSTGLSIGFTYLCVRNNRHIIIDVRRVFLSQNSHNNSLTHTTVLSFSQYKGQTFRSCKHQCQFQTSVTAFLVDHFTTPCPICTCTATHLHIQQSFLSYKGQTFRSCKRQCLVPNVCNSLSCWPLYNALPNLFEFPSLNTFFRTKHKTKTYKRLFFLRCKVV